MINIKKKDGGVVNGVRCTNYAFVFTAPDGSNFFTDVTSSLPELAIRRIIAQEFLIYVNELIGPVKVTQKKSDYNKPMDSIQSPQQKSHPYRGTAVGELCEECSRPLLHSVHVRYEDQDIS